jgi:hypothetical protein
METKAADEIAMAGLIGNINREFDKAEIWFWRRQWRRAVA